MHEIDGTALQRFARFRRARRDDRQLAFALGITDPLIQATALQRIMHFARAIRRHHDEGRMLGAHRAVFGNRYLEVRQQFEQERFERFVGAIDLVDQQHAPRARMIFIGQQRLEQRALQQEFAAIQRAVVGFFAGGFSEAQRHDLPRIVPFVQRARRIEPFVALQPQHRRAEHARCRLRQFRLADARLAFDEKRPFHAQREIERGREVAARVVALHGEKRECFVDRGWLHGSPGRVGSHGSKQTTPINEMARTRRASACSNAWRHHLPASPTPFAPRAPSAPVSDARDSRRSRADRC